MNVESRVRWTLQHVQLFVASLLLFKSNKADTLSARKKSYCTGSVHIRGHLLVTTTMDDGRNFKATTDDFNNRVQKFNSISLLVASLPPSPHPLVCLSTLSLPLPLTFSSPFYLTMRTPKDHQSAVVPWPFLLTTSGAMYSTVPQKENVFFSSTASLLRPKSVEQMTKHEEDGR